MIAADVNRKKERTFTAMAVERIIIYIDHGIDQREHIGLERRLGERARQSKGWQKK
jgi:hypothetical protein